MIIIPDKWTFAKAGGEFLRSLLISGYRSYEMNIFDETDAKYLYIKKFLENRINRYIEEGVEWFVIGGQLGIELWAGEIILELKEKYPNVQLAVILPYTSFEKNWNQTNQELFKRVTHQADYVNFSSNKDYESPKQLRGNQVFMIRNTDGAFLVYDRMNEASADGKPKYLYELMEIYQKQSDYSVELASFEEIEFFIYEYIESYGEIEK